MEEVQIEFFGIARQRAGIEAVRIPVDPSQRTLGEVLSQLGRMLPGLAVECIQGNELAEGYLANINGSRFLRDPDAILPPNCSILIMSADAGG